MDQVSKERQLENKVREATGESDQWGLVDYIEDFGFYSNCKSFKCFIMDLVQLGFYFKESMY